MGYMGFGLQKWIYNQKPRKPFKKRESTLGHEYIEIGNVKDFTLGDSIPPSPEGVEERILESKKRNRLNNKLDRIQGIFIIVIVVSILTIIYIKSRQPNTNSSKYGYTPPSYDASDKEKDAIALFLKSGINLLQWNQIESAEEEFERALKIDPENIEVLNYYVLTLSFDCEQNNKNCHKATFFYEKLQKLDESKISQDVKTRIEVVQGILKKK
jgi:tetratricopeptide (TPR) repeat protein